MICETMAGDNRFEIIAKAKEAILESTNIDTSEDEMKVLDNFLFRCWQMGWLDKYDDSKGGVNCTEFIKWLMDVVLDEEDWRMNPDAYGELICRKLKKLGLLDVTSEGFYTDTFRGGWISTDNRLPSKEDTYLVAWVEQHHECPYPHYYGLAHWDAEEQEWTKPLSPSEDGAIDILAWMPLPDFYWEGVKHETD